MFKNFVCLVLVVVVAFGAGVLSHKSCPVVQNLVGGNGCHCCPACPGQNGKCCPCHKGCCEVGEAVTDKQEAIKGLFVEPKDDEVAWCFPLLRLWRLHKIRQHERWHHRGHCSTWSEPVRIIREQMGDDSNDPLLVDRKWLSIVLTELEKR